ncbi:PLP-dependent aspartate aminotransferase family protein [Acetobacterium wieringae]|uniref:PLP-dependent aspartate aminotransferase family protein n=1 Tax=Acetobacterium wieringae TaxID=52694 RepID=A0ABY6HAK1_9FIRM|nr:PLP-dependent aspartate aminotransferase family protein [Acetobacterium wieringae]UYO61535.1 PLP-dependent aspartate aminotransferase family protein [Acetobacterium wieringae]VUZ28400.1 Cystathionine gamma-synthase [Acetobacterium wieringae]
MDFETLCIHGNNNKYDNTGAISVPIFQTATFAHPGVGESTGYDYTRQQNPTREHLENILTRMEEGVDAMAFSSGMAAISAVMELFSPGDHIIASDDLYGGSHRLFHHISIKNGISFDLVDTADLSLIEPLIRTNTRALFIETPTNPMMQVTDLAGVAEIARKHQLLLMVDNTFLTPYFQKPLKLGADIVIHSGTKYLGGHNDTIAGFVVTRDKTLADKLRFIFKTTGAGLAPFDSWLLIRGIKTLPIRMDRQQQNAGVIARWLCQQERIKAVHYVGLESHPGYQISKRQATGFGGMISFEVDSEKTAHHILEGVKLIQYAESLGGVESLITYPMLQTHGDIPEEQREAKGINNRLLRLSVGIESVNDLIDELDRVLKETVQ